MNQIPNIECKYCHGHDCPECDALPNREEDKIVTIIMQAIAPYYKPYKYLGEKSIETAKNEIMQVLHHQLQKAKEELQKAHQDWLREEIVKLERMKKNVDGEVVSATGFPEAVDYGYNQALDDILTLLQATLGVEALPTEDNN